jgi:DNA-binding transcriptional regulator YiaG
MDAERKGGRMMETLFQIVRKAGGISPCKSSASADWTELGKEFRRAGHQGVIYSNGNRGRAADEMLADLDPDIQAHVLNNAESNHPLLDALSRELDRLPVRYTGTESRFDLEAENERLRLELDAMRARLDVLETPLDESPRIEDIAPGAIREARNALNLTQAQAAERLGVSWLTLSRWENGRTRPKSVNHVRALTALMNEAQTVAPATPF